MIPLCNGFYLFPLARAVKSNSLIFDPSEFKIGLYKYYYCQPRVEVTSCFVYKVTGLTFHDRVNTPLIYKIEIAKW